MPYNLSRNSRVFITTNLNAATNAVLTTGFTPTNTYEIQVMDGFTFSQNTETTNIQPSEAGATPVRGQRAFNTALAPVEISFSTYLRPSGTSTVTTEERILWNALMGTVGVEGTAGVTVGTIGGTPTNITRIAQTINGVTIAATAGSAAFTMGGTSLTVLTANDIYTWAGFTGTGAQMWNSPFKVGTSSATTLTGEYLIAPDSAATTPTSAVSAAQKLYQSAYIEFPAVTGYTAHAQVCSAPSNKNTLMPFGLIFVVDGAWYTVDNCAADSVTIDFGLDAIAMGAWTIKGTRLNNIAVPAGSTIASGGVVLGTAAPCSGTATAKNTTANFIANKLSTVTINAGIGGKTGATVGGASTTTYQVALTGGSITYANNLTYLTPANIGVVNVPMGYFTGTRAVSGSLTAYLKTGQNTALLGDTSKLLTDVMTAANTNTETRYEINVAVGGASNSTRVELNLEGAMLTIPSVEIADLISTTITFTGQGSSNVVVGNNTYDIEATNDLYVRYFSAA